jgi:hypothetical protein
MRTGVHCAGCPSLLFNYRTLQRVPYIQAGGPTFLRTLIGTKDRKEGMRVDTSRVPSSLP